MLVLACGSVQKQASRSTARFPFRLSVSPSHEAFWESQPPAAGASSSRQSQPEADALAGTWEKLALLQGAPLLERRDVWVRLS